MCFLAWRWAGWSVGTSRTDPWLFKLSLRTLPHYELLEMTQQGPPRRPAQPLLLFVLTFCTNGLSKCWCAQCNILLDTWVFSQLYDIIGFIFGMRFGNSLPNVLFNYQGDWVCLSCSEATEPAGGELGNILITTIQSQHCAFRSQRWLATRDVEEEPRTMISRLPVTRWY